MLETDIIEMVIQKNNFFFLNIKIFKIKLKIVDANANPVDNSQVNLDILEEKERKAGIF